MSYSIKEVREAVMTALEPLRQTDGVRTIAPYSGQFDESDDMTRMQQVVTFPALLVSFLSGQPRYFDEGADLPNLRMAVIVAVADSGGQNVREDHAADLLDAVRPLLHNQSLGLDLAEPIRVDEEYLVRVSRRLAIYTLELIVNFPRTV